MIKTNNYCLKESYFLVLFLYILNWFVLYAYYVSAISCDKDMGNMQCILKIAYQTTKYIYIDILTLVLNHKISIC